MFEINMKEALRLEGVLEKLNARGVAFAQRDTINDQAFNTMRIARETIREEFTNRNKWTVRSVQLDKARSTRGSAEVGSLERYMADQEFGASRMTGLNVPTPAASGEAPRAKVRRRVVRKANRMGQFNTGRRSRHRAKNQKQANIIAVQEAIEAGRKYVFQQRGNRKGFYKIINRSKKRPKTRMVQNMTRTVAVVPKHPWLAPSSAAVLKLTPKLYFAQLQRQLDRLPSIK